MAASGERRKATDNQHRASSAVQLADLGIPRDRASRAMQLGGLSEQSREYLSTRLPRRGSPALIAAATCASGAARRLGLAFYAWGDNLLERQRSGKQPLVDIFARLARQLPPGMITVAQVGHGEG